jgi:hypothetical protein
MTRLHETIAIEGCAEHAREALDRFFLSLRGKDGISWMRLRVPTDGSRNGYGISLDREVRVEVRPPPVSEQARAIGIIWRPEGTLAFPTFEGTVTLCTNPHPRHAYIALDGSYTPPLGPAGQVFDAIIGRQIAKATAREFLKDLKDAVERLIKESPKDNET